MSNLTKADIAAGYNNPAWNGAGYLAKRQRALGRPDLVAKADTRLLREANKTGWSAEQFFAWLNSKYGRWYGDTWFSGVIDTLERDIRATITLKDLGV